jgi:hypothetical protein
MELEAAAAVFSSDEISSSGESAGSDESPNEPTVAKPSEGLEIGGLGNSEAATLGAMSIRELKAVLTDEGVGACAHRSRSISAWIVPSCCLQ